MSNTKWTVEMLRNLPEGALAVFQDLLLDGGGDFDLEDLESYDWASMEDVKSLVALTDGLVVIDGQFLMISEEGLAWVETLPEGCLS